VTRILIADEHEVARSALRAMLNTRPGWQVFAEAADGIEAILKAFETKPDIAVVDDLLPLVSAVEVTRQIRARMTFSSNCGSLETLNRAVRCGFRPA
jgi:DNA-binding NarL/FixJ family response regulator